MNATVATTRSLAAAGVLAVLAGSAWARNDKLLLPIEPALRHQAMRSMLAPDIALRFGSASAGPDDTAAVQAHAVADPFGTSNNNAGGTRARRADEVVCFDAFRKALVELQQRARSQGGTAVVGIVSNYNNVVFDSREVYECRIGHTRGVVTLKALVARSLPPVSAPRMQPVPAAPAVVAADPAQPPRIASGFAAIDDVDAIPYLSDRGRQHYREWLALPTPRAFAISHTGYFYATSGLNPKDTTLPSEPSERALAGCERNAKIACKLYAVNGSVVWTKDR